MISLRVALAYELPAPLFLTQKKYVAISQPSRMFLCALSPCVLSCTPATRSWKEVQCHGPSPGVRENNGVVEYKGSLYLFGGYNGSQWLNDFHGFHIGERESRHYHCGKAQALAAPDWHDSGVTLRQLGVVKRRLTIRMSASYTRNTGQLRVYRVRRGTARFLDLCEAWVLTRSVQQLHHLCGRAASCLCLL